MTEQELNQTSGQTEQSPSSAAEHCPDTLRNSVSESVCVTILGAEGAGKTSFFAGMACLGFDVLGDSFALYPSDRETADYFNGLVREFRRGQWTPSTNVTTRLQFRIADTTQGYDLDIVTIDYPGEDFQAAFNRMSLENIDVVADHLLASQIVILLIDVADVLAATSPERSKAIQERLRAKLGAVHVIREKRRYQSPTQSKDTDPGDETPCDRSNDHTSASVGLCICVAKADRLPELAAAMQRPDGGIAFTRRFVHKQLAGFEKKLRQETQIDELVYFPISSVGHTVVDSAGMERPDPQRLAPSGYKPLLNWLVRRVKHKPTGRKRHWFFRLSLVFLLGLIGCSVWMGFQNDRQTRLFTSVVLSPIEKIRESGRLSHTEKLQIERNRLIREQIDQIASGIADTREKGRLLDFRKELNELRSMQLGSFEKQADELIATIDEKIELHDYEHLKLMHKSGHRGFREEAEKFLRDYPRSACAANVQTLLANETKNEFIQEIQEINRLQVRDRSMLEKKGNDILKLIAGFSTQITPARQETMKSGSQLAQSLSQRKKYTVTLQKYGGFAYNEIQRLRITVGNTVVCQDDQPAVKSKERNVAKTFSFDWQYGDVVTIILEADTGVFRSAYETVAQWKFKTPEMPFELDGRTTLIPQSSRWDWSLPRYKSPDGYFVECRVQGLDRSKLQAFRDYVYPGNRWSEELETFQ